MRWIRGRASKFDGNNQTDEFDGRGKEHNHDDEFEELAKAKRKWEEELENGGKKGKE